MIFGIPLVMIGFICFIISAVFIFARPEPKAETSFLNSYILRWFHPMAWAMFGTAATYQRASETFALIILMIGIGIYAAFIMRFLANRKRDE